MSIAADQAPSSRLSADVSRAALMVSDSSAILKRFYFLQRELVIMQAGWTPGTEHFQSKILLPEFLWQDALAAGELRQRVLELRYPQREIEVPPDVALLRLFRSFRDAPHGEAFVEGLRLVVKPLLRRTFQRYLDATDHLDDGPTVRILRHTIADLDEQIGRWERSASDLRQAYPERYAEAQRWVAALGPAASAIEAALLEPGPISEAGQFDPSRGGGRSFAIARRGARDRRFKPILFHWPDGLDPARGPGDGMELQVRQAAHHLNEIWAAEMAAACLFDLVEEAPAEFLTEAARWCYDEVRHCRMGFTRFGEWGFEMGRMPMGSFSYDAGADADPITRLGIIFYFESTYIHTKWQRKKIFGDFGDLVSSHDMDFDWADEQIHAHYGSYWLEHCLRKRGDGRKPIEFRQQAEECIRRIRAGASDEDRRQTEALYERTMSLARASAKGNAG